VVPFGNTRIPWSNPLYESAEGGYIYYGRAFRRWRCLGDDSGESYLTNNRELVQELGTSKLRRVGGYLLRRATTSHSRDHQPNLDFYVTLRTAS